MLSVLVSATAAYALKSMGASSVWTCLMGCCNKYHRTGLFNNSYNRTAHKNTVMLFTSQLFDHFHESQSLYASVSHNAMHQLCAMGFRNSFSSWCHINSLSVCQKLAMITSYLDSSIYYAVLQVKSIHPSDSFALAVNHIFLGHTFNALVKYNYFDSILCA